MIWSTDENFVNARTACHNKRDINNKLFVTFVRSSGRPEGKSGGMNLSAKLARDINMPKYCVLGLSEDKNTLVIIPSNTGNMKVTTIGNGHNKYFGCIYIATFFKYSVLDLQDYPLGRYDAKLEGDSVEGYKIYVNIGDRIPEGAIQ